MLMREIHGHYSEILKKLINLNQKNRPGRIAEALLYLSDDIYGSTDFTLSITKKELSEMAGISTEGSSRILKELNDQGAYSIHKKEVKILDKKIFATTKRKKANIY